MWYNVFMNDPQSIIPSAYQCKIINLAKNVSMQSQFRTFRHGAVLYSKHSILNTAHNISKYNSFASKFAKDKLNATIHAEIGAILNLGRETTEGSSVCVVRTNAAHQMMGSKPCPMCQAAMEFVGIKECFYSSDSNGGFERIRF